MNKDSFIQGAFAERIGGSQFGRQDIIFKFEKIKRAKREAVRNNPGVPLIDLGVGEPDWAAEPEVIDELYEQAQKRENRGYTDNGLAVFQEAAANYMAEVYGVNGLNAQREVLHGIGSKPILALLPLAFINPGDITLMTTPGYPILGTSTKALGGEVVELPLTAANHFLPDLSVVTAEQRRRAKLLYINYPNNPTGATATPDFFAEVVRFAQENNIIVVSDAAYAALTFDGAAPLSFLATPGAKDVGVEIHSLSKAFNMTGWRLAFICGNAQVVQAFAAVKDNNDSGQFAAIQHAGAYCLRHPEITHKTAAKYSRRHNKLVTALSAIGFTVSKPQASFYLYAPIPRQTKSGRIFTSAADFSDFLIREKLLSTVPWDDAGAYVHLSVTFEAPTETDEDAVIAEIVRRLKSAELVF